MNLQNAKYELMDPPSVTWRQLSAELLVVGLIALSLWFLP